MKNLQIKFAELSLLLIFILNHGGANADIAGIEARSLAADNTLLSAEQIPENEALRELSIEIETSNRTVKTGDSDGDKSPKTVIASSEYIDSSREISNSSELSASFDTANLSDSEVEEREKLLEKVLKKVLKEINDERMGLTPIQSNPVRDEMKQVIVDPYLGLRRYEFSRKEVLPIKQRESDNDNPEVILHRLQREAPKNNSERRLADNTDGRVGDEKKTSGGQSYSFTFGSSGPKKPKPELSSSSSRGSSPRNTTSNISALEGRRRRKFAQLQSQRNDSTSSSDSKSKSNENGSNEEVEIQRISQSTVPELASLFKHSPADDSEVEYRPQNVPKNEKKGKEREELSQMMENLRQNLKPIDFLPEKIDAAEDKMKDVQGTEMLEGRSEKDETKLTGSGHEPSGIVKINHVIVSDQGELDQGVSPLSEHIKKPNEKGNNDEPKSFLAHRLVDPVASEEVIPPLFLKKLTQNTFENSKLPFDAKFNDGLMLYMSSSTITILAVVVVLCILARLFKHIKSKKEKPSVIEEQCMK